MELNAVEATTTTASGGCSNAVTPERATKCKKRDMSEPDDVAEIIEKPVGKESDRISLILNQTLGIQSGDQQTKKQTGVLRMNWSDVAEFMNAYNYGMVYFAISEVDLQVLDIGITYDPQGWLAKRSAGHSLEVYNDLAPWHIIGWIQRATRVRDRPTNELIATVKKKAVEEVEKMSFRMSEGSRKQQLFAHLESVLSECFPDECLEVVELNNSYNMMGDTLPSYSVMKLGRIDTTRPTQPWTSQHQNPEELMYNGISDDDIARISFEGLFDGTGEMGKWQHYFSYSKIVISPLFFPDLKAFISKNWPDENNKEGIPVAHPECMTGRKVKAKELSIHEIILEKKSPEKRDTSNPYKPLTSEETWSLVSDIIRSCTQQITSAGDLTPEVFDAMFTLRDVAIKGDILQPRVPVKAKFPQSKNLKTCWFNMSLAAQKQELWPFRFFFYSVFAMMMLDCSHLRRRKAV